MIRIKVYTLNQIVGAAVIALLVIAAIIVGICMFNGGKEDVQQTDHTVMAHIEPAAHDDAPIQTDKPMQLLAASTLNWKKEPIDLLAAVLPVEQSALPVTADAAQGDVPDDLERIRVEISRIEGAYEGCVDKPRVLLYHTHSYEAYEQDPNDRYEETTQWRTEEMDYNIMGVGAQLKRELEALGVEVVHDLTEHEPPKLGTAYVRSLDTLEEYAQAGETFDMMIDLHRDAASSRNTNPSTVQVEGMECARLMMLIGTGEGSEGNRFSIVPNWQENYKLAQALTDALNAQCDGLCREVMVKTGRYNQHMSESAVLIEVGHNKNALQEALNATKPLAKAIAQVLMGDD